MEIADGRCGNYQLKTAEVEEFSARVSDHLQNAIPEGIPNPNQWMNKIRVLLRYRRRDECRRQQALQPSRLRL